MSGQVFGLHGVMAGERDIDELMRRFDALSAALSLDGVPPRQRHTSAARGVSHGYARAGAPTLDVLLGVDAGQTHLLIHEDRDAFEPYDLALVVEWFTGLCDISNPLFARAYCRASLDGIAIGEAEDRPRHLTWWQYLGPAMTARMGHMSLLFGPYVRVDPRDTGGCVVWTSSQPTDVEIAVPAPTTP